MSGGWDPRRLTASSRPSLAFVIALVASYVLIVGVVAAHHEPWRDEADPWLYVRDADFGTILARSRYAGFPALWFLCLAPLAKLGLPYASQSALHILIAAATVAILAARAPLTRLTTVLLVASYFFSYEYAVIVRSYALSILLIVIAAAMHRSRNQRPLVYAVVLFLMANVNAQGFFASGALAGLFVLEHLAARTLRGHALAAALIMAAGGLLVWIQVRKPADAAAETMRHVLRPQAFEAAVGSAFFPTAPQAIGFVGGMLVLLVLTLALRRSQSALFVFWVSVAALSAIYAFVWYGGLRHAGFILVFAIVAIWIGSDSIDAGFAPAAAILLNVSLLFSTVIAVRYWMLDTTESFSGAEEMADFIHDHHLERFEIAAHNLTQCEALLPYLPGKRFWYAGLGSYGTYLMWDSAFERALDVPYPSAERRAIAHFDGRPWLLLFNVEMPDPPAHGFRLLYTNQKPIFEKTDERFWLYQPIQSRSQ